MRLEGLLLDIRDVVPWMRYHWDAKKNRNAYMPDRKIMGAPSGRERLIKIITNGFAFFALLVLVTETLLAWTAVQIGQGADRTFLLISGVSLLTLLTVIVALLLYFRPWVLTGDPPPAEVIRQLTPPPYTETRIPIQYFLKGVRENYIHVLADVGKPPPNGVRINLMLILSATSKSKEKALRIIHVDYPGLFATDEFLEEYMIGVANCGEAWRLGQQRAWASDLPDAKRVDMKEIVSPTAQARNSVLSSPILCGSDCIGVLNLDSNEGSKTTHIQLPVIQNLLAEAAREIVPLLFPAARDDNGG